MHRAQWLCASSLFAVVLATVAVGCSSPTVTTSPASVQPSTSGSSVPGPTASPTGAGQQEAQIGDTLDLVGTGDGERMAVTVTRVGTPGRPCTRIPPPTGRR